MDYYFNFNTPTSYLTLESLNTNKVYIITKYTFFSIYDS